MGESHQTAYILDAETYRRARRQYLLHRLRKGWWWHVLVCVGVVAIIVDKTWRESKLDWWEGGILWGFVLVILVLGIIAEHRSWRAKLAKTLPQNTIVVLSDDLLDVSSNEERTVVKWQNVTRLVATRDFIIAMRGGFYLMVLPKECATSELLAFIREKAKERQRRRSPA